MDRQRLLQHKVRNELQQLGLLGVLALLLGYLAWVVGGEPFMWGTLIGVMILYFINPVASPRLLVRMYGALPLSPREAPGLYAIVEALAARAGLARLPRLYYLPSRMMNAFATGRRQDAAIVISDGLLRRLERRELIGVLAHELAHVANGDIQVMAFADTLSRITGILAFIGQMLVILSIPALLLGLATPPLAALLLLLAAPTLSALAQLALSRNREYEADRSAVELCGDALGLASALDKMERHQGRFWEQIMLPGRNLPDPSLLRTHPPTRQRIDRLMELIPQEELRRPLALPLDDPRELLALLARGGSRAPRWHITGLWH